MKVLRRLVVTKYYTKSERALRRPFLFSGCYFSCFGDLI